MPARARAKTSALAERVYNSPATQEQVRFRPRKKTITYRQSTGATRRTKQQTLTQIDFVSSQVSIDDEENEDSLHYEEDTPRRKKHRRTEEYRPPSTAQFHTQTLTQLDFVSTPASRLELEEENLYDAEDIKEEPAESPITINSARGQVMGPPETPIRRRAYEIPSSQSPATPPSNRSRKSFNTRSPLKAINSNIQVLSSPRQNFTTRKPVKLEVSDTFETVKESQETIQQSHEAPAKQSQTNNLTQYDIDPPPAESLLTRDYRRWIKEEKEEIREIRDSDEEDEEDYGIDDDYAPGNIGSETQIQADIVKSCPTDTQEAGAQLQSNILQFTQSDPLISQTASYHRLRECEPPRPSQATTVSLTQSQYESQHVRSSPPKQSYTSTQAPDSQEESLIIEESQPEADREREETTIPDSPFKELPLALPTSSPYLPHLRMDERGVGKQGVNDMNIPFVPFSIAPSQLLTRSQMLPESLMEDSVPPPPPLYLIEDSEGDE